MNYPRSPPRSHAGLQDQPGCQSQDCDRAGDPKLLPSLISGTNDLAGLVRCHVTPIAWRNGKGERASLLFLSPQGVRGGQDTNNPGVMFSLPACQGLITTRTGRFAVWHSYRLSIRLPGSLHHTDLKAEIMKSESETRVLMAHGSRRSLLFRANQNTQIEALYKVVSTEFKLSIK